MYDIEHIETEAHSDTAITCENAALFGATPQARRVRPSRHLGPRRRHSRAERSLPHPRRGSRTRQLPARRQAREPAVGHRQRLRRSFASRALALGESLSMIGKLLGHNKIDTTARYAHLARDSIKASSARVADSIGADIL